VRAARLGELSLELTPPLDGDPIGVILGEPVEGEEVLEVRLAHGRSALDHLIHERLGEGRLVALVVAPAAVAIHVDDHVALEGPPEFQREPHDPRHRVRVLAIDVEDGDLESSPRRCA
jgi:hypothetical protein